MVIRIATILNQNIHTFHIITVRNI